MLRKKTKPLLKGPRLEGFSSILKKLAFLREQLQSAAFPPSADNKRLMKLTCVKWKKEQGVSTLTVCNLSN